MNRLAMADEIVRRVLMLALCYKDEWKQSEQLRTKFVADYPLARIPRLTLDQYVIGKGSANRSFCYRIEREMDTLGKIVGATAFKFGVYFGHTNTNSTDQYRFAKHWGNSHVAAFVAVKQAIVDLLKAAGEGDSDAIASNTLSPMFKGKILFLYYPDQFAPIYSAEHLGHFIAALDLDGSFRGGADMQTALMDYRKTWPQLLAQPVALYMRFLYDLFGVPPKTETQPVSPIPKVPFLNDAVEGATYIATMPPLSPAKTAVMTISGSKTNHEARQRSLKRIGDRGEALVLALEKRRLMDAGKPHLAKKIDHVAERSDAAGYDILSFDEDGSERPVEVKATSAPNLDQGFYLTANELAKASSLANYHIYFVFQAMSKHPKVLPVKKPDLKGPDFVMQALNFHVTKVPK